MKKSFVLKANKEVIILNWIKNYIWHGKDLEVSFKNSLEHYNTMDYIECDISIDDVKKYMINYVKSLENENIFNTFLKRLMDMYIKINFKSFIEDCELNFKSKNHMHLFIINTLIPAITL